MHCCVVVGVRCVRFVRLCSFVVSLYGRVLGVPHHCCVVCVVVFVGVCVLFVGVRCTVVGVCCIVVVVVRFVECGVGLFVCVVVLFVVVLFVL